MISFDDVKKDLQFIVEDLLDLCKTPGPTQACARINSNGPRNKEEYDISKKIKEILKKRISNDKPIHYFEDNGNLVIVGGIEEPTVERIRKIPVALISHMDEITFIIGNKTKNQSKNQWKLLPFCNPPKKYISSTDQFFMHPEAKILGYRDAPERKLIPLGTGKFYGFFNPVSEENEYLLETSVEEIRAGDLAIQNYGVNQQKRKYDINSVIRIKALDDRAGVIAHLYTLKYLIENEDIPIKVIIAGDEEGYPEDVSWARLISYTVRKYCDHSNILLITDGADGKNLKEFMDEKRDEYLHEALMLPYTSYGKGGGDNGIFSILRDKVLGQARNNGFEAKITTDYVSRSVDPKLMNEFPFIGFIDWSNGKIGNQYAICHLDESIVAEQLVNIIGLTYHGVTYFTRSLS